MHTYKTVKINKLTPYAKNSRTHSEKQIKQIVASIKEFGFTNPVLIDNKGTIIAGHGRVLAAKELGLVDIPCIELKGLTATQKKAYVIADNQLALNAGWDLGLLSEVLEELKLESFDVDLLGFGSSMLNSLNGESAYTQKTAAITYTTTGKKPDLKDIYDKTKYNKLVKEISNCKNLPEDVREFLVYSATRHIVFDFEQIAEFYCHASAELQNLMESSALVIIDFDRAIQEGYVKLTKEIQDAYAKEKLT